MLQGKVLNEKVKYSQKICRRCDKIFKTTGPKEKLCQDCVDLSMTLMRLKNVRRSLSEINLKYCRNAHNEKWYSFLLHASGYLDDAIRSLEKKKHLKGEEK